MRVVIFILYFCLLSISVFAQKGNAHIDTLESDKYSSLAVEFLNSNEIDKAINYFKKSLEHNPNNTLAYSGLAFVAYQAQNYNVVINYASLGLAVFDNDKLQKNDVYLDLIKLKAYSLVLLNNSKEAIPYLSEAIDMNEEDSYIYHQRSIAYSESGNLELALKDIQTAYLLEPDDPGVLAALGQLLYYFQDYKNSLVYLHKSNKLLVEIFLPNYYYLGLSYFYLDDYTNCIKNLEGYLNHRTDARVPEEEIQAKFHLGVAYLNVENYKSAIPYLKQVVEHNNQNVLAHYWYAFSVAADDLPKGQSLLEDYKQRFPKEGVFDKTLGDMFNLKADTTNAKYHYLTAVEKGTEVIDTLTFYREIAKGFTNVNDTIGLIKCWEIATGLLPESSIAIRKLLNTYELLNVSSNGTLYLPEIIDLLDRLIDIHQNNKEQKAYFMAYKGVMHISQGSPEIGFKEIDNALEIHSFAEYYALRSFALFITKLRNYQENEDITPLLSASEQILQDVDNALQSNHRRKDAYLLKTTILIALDRNKEACEVANEAIKLGASINKDQLNYICKGKKLKEKNNEWEFFYNLSSFDERFSE